MDDVRPISSPLAIYFTLANGQFPMTIEEKDFMAEVHYASTIVSLMYAMVCIRPYIVGSCEQIYVKPMQASLGSS